MPTYKIEHYEIHTMTYEVEASSEAKAIKKLFDGQAEPVDDSLVFIEVNDDVGLPVDEFRDLAEELQVLGVSIDEDLVPSISQHPAGRVAAYVPSALPSHTLRTAAAHSQLASGRRCAAGFCAHNQGTK